MATINLGRVKPVFRGAYNASTAYVIDDIVTYQGSAYIAITATTGNLPTVTANWTKLAAKGTDVGTTLTTQGDILYRDASGLARLGAGTSGQALLTQGTGANPQWGDVSSEVVKITTYENSTRTVLSGSTNGTIFNDITISKVKDATTSKIIVIGFLPGEFYASYHSGLYFVCTTTGMDNSGTNNSSAFRGIGQSYGFDTNAPGMLHLNKTFQDTTNLGTGSHTFKIGWRSRDGATEVPADIINPNTTDDGRAHQTGTFIQLMEVLI